MAAKKAVKKSAPKKAAKKTTKKPAAKAAPGTGRCMKCKKQVVISGGKESKTANGMRMLKGSCPKCNTTVCRILGKAK